jgi:hypothetical protein
LKKIALVTTTFSKSAEDLRFRLALKTCQAAQRSGHSIYIVDGSPNSSIRELLLGAGATAVAPEHTRGMGASRRQCLQMGLDSGADVIVWLEPEKYSFVPFIADCARMVIAGDDIVIPGRYTLEGYPRYQELSELRAMRRIGILTCRPDIDWMFGPRVMSRRAAELLLTYTGQAGGDTWHILVVPVLWALMNDFTSVTSGFDNAGKCLKITSRLVNYIHPPEQSAAEEGDAEMDKKRDLQRKVLEEVVEKEMLSLRQRRLDRMM